MRCAVPARHTAREARTIGVNWNFAPVADLDVEPVNPVINTRALGSQGSEVGDYVAEWIDACQSEGVLACAKHFPGHGRTDVDSHLTLPVVSAPQSVLMSDDMLPFRSAIDAGVGSIMTAHVAFPSIDPSGVPATLSREILTWVLRQRCEYENLIVADSINMQAVLQGGLDEGEAAVRAIIAGCDLVLAPGDLHKVVASLEAAVAEGRIERDRLRQSQRRRLKWAQWVSPPNDYRRPPAPMCSGARGSPIACCVWCVRCHVASVRRSRSAPWMGTCMAAFARRAPRSPTPCAS